MSWRDWSETVQAALGDARAAESLDREPGFRTLLREDADRALSRFELYRSVPGAPVLPIREIPAAWRLRYAR